LSVDGRADYVYPEITGYYLQWLAWHAIRHGPTPDIASRANAAQRWLSAWAASSSPGTRVYVGTHGDDWRNQAVFFFDVAMVLRGLAWAARASLIAPDVALIENIGSLLRRLIAADGMFDACVSASGANLDTLPQRWSTRRGAFLTKAADGVLFAAQHLPHVPVAIESAAFATFDASMYSAIHAPHAETHPSLYALEGLLNRDDPDAGTRGAALLAPQFAALMSRVEESGHLAETSRGNGARRLDIVAQAIRADAMLHAHAHAGTDRRAIAAMAALLVHHTTGVGAIPFASDQQPPQFNVWTAMFAEQALTLAQYRLAGRAIPWTDACLV
jgi:hypothetical protein